MARVWLNVAVYQPGLEGAPEPVTGATVYVYAPGTTTQVSVYPTLVGGVAIPQPLSSSDGMVAGYVEPGTYDALIELPTGESYPLRIERPSGTDLRIPLPTKAGAFTEEGEITPVEPAILLEGVTKAYEIGGRAQDIVPIPGRFRRKDRVRVPQGEAIDFDGLDDDFDEPEDDAPETPAQTEGPPRTVHALQDVSFEVAAGSSVGVFGTVAAGKTTLLRILARVTPPTEGRAVIRGRVAPLLELASRLLVSESTGRENVFWVARLFGVPRAVAERNLDSIFAFAELTGKEDHPARTYSGRQYRRLGFSIALNLESDVILADEHVVTGDPEFSERVIERLGEARDRPVTLLYASNDMNLIREFCNEVILLEEGRMIERGTPDEIEEAAAEQRRRHKARRRERAGEVAEVTAVANLPPPLLDPEAGALLDALLIGGGSNNKVAQLRGVALGSLVSPPPMEDRDLIELVDYVSGQQRGEAAQATRERLTHDPTALIWFGAVAAHLRRLGLRVPVQAQTPPVFEFRAALFAGADVIGVDGRPAVSVPLDEQLVVRMRIAVAVPDTVVRVSVILEARRAERRRKLNQPTESRFAEPGIYDVELRLPPGLGADSYSGRVILKVASREYDQTVDQREAFRFAILPPDGGGGPVEVLDWSAFARDSTWTVITI